MAQDKFTTIQRVDQFISAEIPSNERPKLREIVLKCMTHGPCGSQYPNSPCMKDGHCSKQFPKAFIEKTILNVDGYPLYRRRTNECAIARGKQVDSRNIVPYNPYLTLKYNAHINVEVATSLRFVKYLYKYLFKGFDCATVIVGTNGHPQLCMNEISNYIDCRYVSAPEAIWRLREYKMHDRSHAVMRLPVHLPNQQRITFEEGHEEEALLAAQTNKTKLESWFDLNVNDLEARQYLYTDIPYNYVYVCGQWQKRKKEEIILLLASTQ
ncbi:uncharacterized protein [Chironomus tepperi]|uniref:uncharacterized protein n=1 Tax=Chironomus tepperi TaxID=113505 RepID=UPI00391F6268